MKLKEAHKHSSNHTLDILSSSKCGCFYCCHIFSPTDIYEWIDNRQTALCPKCGIDSVLPDNKVDFDAEFLAEMQKFWFSR